MANKWIWGDYFDPFEVLPPKTKDEKWICPCIMDRVFEFRKELGSIVVVNDYAWGGSFKYSGFRFFHQNVLVGGARNSFHKMGRALDLKFVEVKPSEVVQLCREYFNGVIFYRHKNFIHVDNRNDKYFEVRNG